MGFKKKGKYTRLDSSSGYWKPLKHYLGLKELVSSETMKNIKYLKRRCESQGYSSGKIFKKDRYWHFYKYDK